METEDRYDCIECGHINCVKVTHNNGFCTTDGCIMNQPIQLVYYPNWQKPKTSRAGREIWWIPGEQPPLPSHPSFPKTPI